ncbi:RagB/SusD family nutrient uptake outer membrane protein [Echinicola sp. 20G]|uniref:RagB/SusD family nutrient uptake outer membrane protein n=1 Tax=Echinicola sp. 20G TaxID=2781961 RepID=UPI001910185C|nr:RagB/SusD family nutrient uptake outer membrane protein [Echinicola sp. 20G]
MKRYRLIIVNFLFVGITMLASCEGIFEEALNRADDSREDLAGMLSDPNKIRGMLTSAYMGVPENRSYLYFWTTEESLTDNTFNFQGQSMGNWRSGLLSPSNAAVWANSNQGNSYMNPTVGWWGRYWGAIRHCNTLINNMDGVMVTEDELPLEERELMLDEAKVLRAYYHFKLISMYGPVPYMYETPELGFAGWADMSRPTFQEITDQIVAELDEVISNGNIPIKREPFNTNDKYRVPLGFVYGLKSRVLLYNASPLNNPTGDPQKYLAAAEAAKRFLDIGQYSLEPFENTKGMYISPMSVNVEQTEVIWRYRDRLGQFSNVHGMDLATAKPKRSNYPNFKAGETPSQEIVDAYELKNGALIVENYDATHAEPTFTAEALASGYDDENNPYENRDDRFYRDILFNGSSFGQSYQLGEIIVWTYLDAPGTGSNGNVTSGSNRKTFTGYYFGKDRDPLWYGAGSKGQANNRVMQHGIVMRYAEIYLNYAEALCGAGKFEEACDALDMTRLRANQPSIRQVPDYMGGNTDWLMKRIQNERRVELVLEDHRFYDIRRWDIISDQNHNTISGMEVTKVADGEFKHIRYQIPFAWECHNEKYKVLPIPIVDKKLLPNMDQPEAWQ